MAVQQVGNGATGPQSHRIVLPSACEYSPYDWDQYGIADLGNRPVAGATPLLASMITRRQGHDPPNQGLIQPRVPPNRDCQLVGIDALVYRPLSPCLGL